MPLRLVNRDRTYPVDVDGTILQIISMTVAEKESLIYSLSTITEWATANKGESVTNKFLELLSKAIVSIDDHEGEPMEFLNQLEDMKSLGSIAKAISEHCDLTVDESKNSDSLSEQVILERAGSVEVNANPEQEHASTTVNQEQ